MKAVRIHAYGGPDVLQYEEAPKPAPGPDELLIRVLAAGVNPVDWKIRQGKLKDFIHYDFPLILGWDLSGVVEQVGDRVTGFKVGDAVYARPDIRRNGAYAQYIVVRAAEVAPKPALLDHIEAAAVPLAGITAWEALFTVGGLQPGQRVLIHGAAGGVGTLAVQLAKAKGAYVIATTSTRNAELVSGLGADEVIDYTCTRFEDAARDVDVVFDTIGGETQARSWQVLKPGGILVSIIQPPDAATAQSHGVRGAYLFIDPNAAVLRQIALLIDEGKVHPVIDRVYPLTEAREAQMYSETGHASGKIVMTVFRDL